MASSSAGMLWLNNFADKGPEMVVKGFMVVGMLMYVFFSLIVMKQVGIMTETFESEVNGSVKAFAWLHFLMSVFVLALVVLVA